MGSRRPGVSLYVRRLPEDARQEDVRNLFEKYGPIRDVYVPMDYYTRRPRGFCYVEYEDERDAEDGQRALDGSRYLGSVLEIEFAMGDRKTPGQMRGKYNPRGERGYGRRESRRSPHRENRRRRRSPSRSPRRSTRSPRRSRSPRNRSPVRRRSPSRSPPPTRRQTPPRSPKREPRRSNRSVSRSVSREKVRASRSASPVRESRSRSGSPRNFD